MHHSNVRRTRCAHVQPRMIQRRMSETHENRFLSILLFKEFFFLLPSFFVSKRHKRGSSSSSSSFSSSRPWSPVSVCLEQVIDKFRNGLLITDRFSSLAVKKRQQQQQQQLMFFYQNFPSWVFLNCRWYTTTTCLYSDGLQGEKEKVKFTFKLFPLQCSVYIITL